jgi:hypothetical protein
VAWATSCLRLGSRVTAAVRGLYCPRQVSVRGSFSLVHQMRVVAEHIPGFVVIHFVSRTYTTNLLAPILAWNPVAYAAAEFFPLAKYAPFSSQWTYNGIPVNMDSSFRVPNQELTTKKEIRYWTSRASRGVPHPIYRLGISNRNIFDMGGGPRLISGFTVSNERLAMGWNSGPSVMGWNPGPSARNVTRLAVSMKPAR